MSAISEHVLKSPPPKHAFSESWASVLLDLVRGLAALLVMGEHWRLLLYVLYAQLPQRSWFLGCLYVVCGAGHAAVIIFFVLSGYLVGGSVFRSLKRQWSWKSYLTHRLVRLWIVLLPGLALCALLDTVRLHWTHAALFHAPQSIPHLTSDFHGSITWTTFAGNLVFLQNIRVLTFGSDDALWSLANEFWYYLMFPAALLCFYARGMLHRLVCGMAFLAMLWFLPSWITFEFPIWLMGVALVFMRPPQVGNVVRWLAVLLYLPFVFFCSKSRLLQPLGMDYLVASGTFLLLWVLLSARQKVEDHPIAARLPRGLARFSFTLYVLHRPLLVLLAKIVRGDARWFPTGHNLLLGFPLLIATLLAAYVVAWMTEFRTDKVRRAVEARLASL